MVDEVRVALAEDEAIIRLDLRETLEEEGYTVVGDTGRGDEMLELVAATDPDVVILDIKMPGMDGIEVARRIARSHDAAVVILTAYSQRDLIDQAIEAGALAYLVKPFQRSELVPAVEIARARHREMRALTDQAQTLADRLEARKTIDRARGVLMDEAGLTEADAFRFIQQVAMNERASMVDVACQVLDGGRRPAS
ncbi:MAG: response regulator [Acidimicrobiaceae bacterium]|nr:response regulator [Acidimicrobiaceae bacterium]